MDQPPNKQFVLVQTIKVPIENWTLVGTHGKKAFLGFRKKGNCAFQEAEGRIAPLGSAEENCANSKLIFDALEEVQKKAGVKDFQVLLELLVPQNCCGYVIGTQGKSIKQLKTLFAVDAWIVPNKVVKLEGVDHSKMIVRGGELAKVRGAHREVQRLVDELAQKPVASPKQENGVKANNNEQRVPIPAAQTEEFMAKFPEIEHSFEGVLLEVKQNGQGLIVKISGEEFGKVFKALRKVKDQLGIMQKAAAKAIEAYKPPESDAGEVQMAPKSLPERKELAGKKAPVGVKAKAEEQKQPPKQPANGPSKQAVQWHYEEILIPTLILPTLLANHGKLIKSLSATLKSKFGVTVRMMGDNCMEYPDGRTMRATGKSPEAAKAAIKHVDDNIILPFCEKTGQWIPTAGEGILEERVKVARKVTEDEGQMVQMKKRTGLFDYNYSSCREEEGIRTVILRGTEEAVESAKKELEEMSAAAKQAQPNGQEIAGFGTAFVPSAAVNGANAPSKAKGLNVLGTVRDPRPKPQYEQGKCRPPTADLKIPAFSKTGRLPLGSAPVSSGPPKKAKPRSRSTAARLMPSLNNGKKAAAVVEDDDLASVFSLQGNKAKKSPKSKPDFGLVKKGSHIDESIRDALLEDQEEESMCLACGKAKRNVVFLACQHLLLCQKCATNKCPACGLAGEKIVARFK